MIKLLVPAAICAALITGCASPSKPTQPDERTRRPANTPEAIDLAACRSHLSEIQSRLTESAQSAVAAEAALAQLQAEVVQRQAGDPSRPTRIGQPAGPTGLAHPNVIWTLRYSFNSSRIEAPPSDLKRLTDAATAAALVVVKGRTDGTSEAPGESEVARSRADGMRRFLVQAGVDPKKIDVQYQPVGDYVVPNTSEQGRAANRRVEVELYSAMPDRRLLAAQPIVAGVRPNPL